MNGLCSRLTFFSPRRTIVFFYLVLDTKWSTCITTKNALFCTSTHVNVYCVNCVGDVVYMHVRFFFPAHYCGFWKIMWHLWCLQIFILTPKLCSHSIKLQHLVILAAATELTSICGQLGRSSQSAGIRQITLCIHTGIIALATSFIFS